VPAEKAKAKCLAEALPSKKIVEKPAAPVVLYLDRSASMHGFLDEPVGSKTDFSHVLDAVIAGLQPTVHGYGQSITDAPASIGVLGHSGFYSDRDTRMEAVVDLIEKDAEQSNVHLIVGDGRRGSKATAESQYVRLRDAAQRWIQHGGSFLVATSMAPFKTVASDPSGCRASASVPACPIYLFAYVPAGQELRIASAITDVFQHLFMWPAPSVPGTSTTVAVVGSAGSLNVNTIWERAASGEPIVRTSAPARTTTLAQLQVTVGNPSAVANRAFQALLDGSELKESLMSRLLSGARTTAWGDASNGGLVARAAGASVSVRSLGGGPVSSISRLALVPTGSPSWLSTVESHDPTDPLRTYGIDRLFEAFRQHAKLNTPAPVAQVFFVSN
jgi:hypothetical protein